MHKGDREFLNWCRSRWIKHFDRADVLELGAQNVNGSARSHFTRCTYVGVDVAEAPGADLVCSAADAVFLQNSFDTLVCLSMFEHDPGWRESLRSGLAPMRDGGLVVLSWGGEGNERHPPYPWAPVPSHEVSSELEGLGVHVIELFPQESRFDGTTLGIWCAVGRTPE